jgi:hypothetical protein
MRGGRITGILEGDEINELEVMRYATGLKGSASGEGPSDATRTAAAVV